MKQSSGFSLLEVLVSCFILTTLVFTAMMVLQEQRVELTQLTRRMLASNQLEIIVERLRANKMKDYQEREWVLWKSQTQKILPHSHSKKYCVNTFCKICLIWEYRKSLCIKEKI